MLLMKVYWDFHAAHFGSSGLILDMMICLHSHLTWHLRNSWETKALQIMKSLFPSNLRLVLWELVKHHT